MALIHCIYASNAPALRQPATRAALLAAARMQNARTGITGSLLLMEDTVLHILEGDADDVDELFLHIANDPRHDQVREIVRETIAARQFGDSPLAFRVLERTDALASDLWPRHAGVMDFDAHSALQLLRASHRTADNAA